MSIEEKHVLSHRGKAFRALAKKLDELTRNESPTA
jgi:inosine/xanthosine triphosphate pyrophosphatase family protein